MSSRWRTAPLGDIAELQYGFTEKATHSGDARFVRITDISDSGTLRSDGAKYIALTDGARGALLRKNDILVARTGATYGKTMLFSEDYPAVFASFLIRIRLPESLGYAPYIWQFAQSSEYWNQTRALVAGGAQPQFNANVLKRIEVPLPPLDEQRRIADVLGTWDSAIGTVQKLVEYKRAQGEWAARELLERRRAPAYRRTTLGDLARIRSGNTPSKSNAVYWDGNHPWVSARDMKTLVISDSAKRLTGAGYSEASVAPKNSLLMLTRGMTLFKDVPVCIAGADVAFNQDVKALIVEAETNAVYVAFLLRIHKNDLLGLVDSAGHGTGRLDTEALREFPLLLPPRVTQDEIVETLLTAHREIEVLRSLGMAYENQKRALMSVLFTSEGVDS